MKTMGNDILTPEQIAQGWRHIGEITNEPDDAYFEIMRVYPKGAQLKELWDWKAVKLLNHIVKSVSENGGSVLFRVLTPITPNTLTISVDDAKNLVSFNGVYDAGKVLLSTKTITKQLEAMK